MKMKYRFHGVIPLTEDLKDVNDFPVGNDFCGNPDLIKPENRCPGVVDDEALENFFASNCADR